MANASMIRYVFQIQGAVIALFLKRNNSQAYSLWIVALTVKNYQ